MPTFHSRAAFADQQLVTSLSDVARRVRRAGRPSGAIRPHWRTFVDRASNALGPGRAVRERWEQARQLIHDNGVSFNVYGDRAAWSGRGRCRRCRCVLAPDEFAALAAGLAQRARLLDRAARRPLRAAARARPKGCCRPSWCSAHPGFLRACARLVAAAAGASCTSTPPIWCARPTGASRVLDRSHAGAVGRGLRAREPHRARRACCPRRSATATSQRLAPFFRTLRDTLAALAPHDRDNPRIVLLTPGPVQRDLLRAGVPGAVPRLHAGRGRRPDGARRPRLPEDAGRPAPGRRDPAPRSTTTSAIRSSCAPTRRWACRACCRRCATGNVAVANALGSGVLQTRGADAVPAALCRALLGEELQLPSVETWWCGEPRVLRARAGQPAPTMVIKPAYPDRARRSRSSATRSTPARARRARRRAMRAAPARSSRRRACRCRPRRCSKAAS